MRIPDIVAVCFLLAASERLTTLAAPTPVPTRTPTRKPSKLPTSSPSQPTSRPSSYPTSRPTSSKPSRYPTTAPFKPSKAPFKYPTLPPNQPTSRPSGLPSGQPTSQPTGHPSVTRTYTPTVSPQPSGQPSAYPSSTPTSLPTSNPTMSPTISSEPTGQPSSQPSSQPSAQPSGQPTTRPTDPKPTGQPSGQPTRAPSRPTGQPTAQPSRQPTSQPTRQPTGQPTAQPSRQPTGQPTSKPSIPTGQPSAQPSAQPSSMPTFSPVIAIPSGQPTSSPSGEPSGQPTSSPTSQPSVSPRPTSHPTGMPSGQPSSQPTQFDATVRPTGKYARSVATGVVKLDPLNADFCIPVELDIEISFTTVVSSGDYFTLHTPGLTSGACSYPTNGASITSLALFNSSLASAAYTEGDRLTNYQTSTIKFTAKEEFMAGELYHFRIDRSNKLKRTCVHNTTWTVYMEHASLQGSLTFDDSHPTECFSYNSSLSFFPPYPQLNIGINFTFLLPFSLNLGDSITLLLPGFSNKIADYPLNGMISGVNNTESYVIGAGSNAQLVNITQQFNTTTLLWSTPYGWKGRWIEGSLATGNDSQLILYPQGLDPLNRAVWVVIDGYENHLVSLVGRQMNYSGFKIDVRSAHFSVNQSSVTTSTAIGSGCNEFDGCNGNGNCDYEKSSCDCFDGFGSASDLKNTYLNNFAPDCSGRSCPKGPAFVALPRLVSQGYHQSVECSNNGICSRITGNCTCFGGFSGVACEKMGCPGSPMCSGRGLCYSMGQLPAVSTAVPLRAAAATYMQYVNQVNTTSNSTIWDADRGHACVCDSSWTVGLGANQTQQAEYFGPACELRHCPSGNDPGTAHDETNCTGVIPSGGRVAGLEGNKCQVDCSNRGICDYSAGVCACFDGYTGVACNTYSKGVRMSLN